MDGIPSLRHVNTMCSGSYFSHRGCFIGEVCEMVMERFMKPTNNLRFVKRVVPIQGEPYDPNGSVGRVVHILQQMWVHETKIDIITGQLFREWRDVPTEEE